MGVFHVVGAALSIGLFGYLFVAMLKPEKF